MAAEVSKRDKIYKELCRHKQDNPVTVTGLMKATGCSRQEINRAIDELITNGKIIGCNGGGYFTARRRVHIQETIDALIMQRDKLDRRIRSLQGRVEPRQRIVPGIFIQNGHESTNRAGLIIHRQIPRGANTWFEVSRLKFSKGTVLITGTGKMTETAILTWIKKNSALPAITVWRKNLKYFGEIATVM